MVMHSHFCAAKATKKALCHVCASTIQRIGFTVVDTLYRVMRVQDVPAWRFIGMNYAASLNSAANRCNRCIFRLAHIRKCAAIAFAHDDNDFTFARLINLYTAIFAILFLVRWFDVTANVAAVDF